MLAFGGSALTIYVAGSITIQTFYRKTALFAKATVVDEVIGGILGALQAILLVGALILVLDSYFDLPGVAATRGELGFLRDIYNFYSSSQVVELFRASLIPLFLLLFGWIVPSDLRELFRLRPPATWPASRGTRRRGGARPRRSSSANGRAPGGSGGSSRWRPTRDPTIGPRTPGSAPRRGPPRCSARRAAYVYGVYGMHVCLNVVAGPSGQGAAILLRGVEPLEGIAWMRASRLVRSVASRRAAAAGAVAEAARIARLPVARLAAGPANLAAAFDVERSDDGVDLLDPAGGLRLEAGDADERLLESIATTRVGVAYAGPGWADRPWRFVMAGAPIAAGA
jgi:DNA-3-methyladenine glycosylase